MTLIPGSRLGSFEVLSPLGSGGMGEVYRARDPRLEREVALKLLPASFADDPQRVERFEWEARLLASLNHPHIAAVHGFEQADSHRFLVLELVPGETLADRLGRGPIDVRQALALCRQVAEALEEAHAKGVVHRDLKPANIKITPEGRVKVLDFGLAKALESEPSPPPLDESPTRTRHTLSDGLIIGTAGYMSPEQARGQAVDKRADIWAFGCVLYESLTGRKLFSGPSPSDSLAAVLTLEPDWTALPPRTPPLVRSLLRRCLEKDKDQRLHDIADARLEIEEALAEPSGALPVPGAPATLGPSRLRRDVVAFVLGGLAGALGVWLGVRPKPVPTAGARARLHIALPRGLPLLSELGGGFHTLALSADGQRVAFVGDRPDGRSQIFVRRIDRLSPEAIPGTEEGGMPFFSADGEWLGFWSEGKLKKVPLSGGEPVVICDAPDPRGASWGADGTILFPPDNAGGLYRVPASGGKPEVVTRLDPTGPEDSHRWPQILPAGKAAVFSVQPLSGREAERSIAAVSLVTGQKRTLVRGGSHPVYAGGYLFFGRAGELLAAPFDPDRLELRGEARPVLEDVRMDPKQTGRVDFDLSPGGTLVYVPGFPKPDECSLVFMDRQGRASAATSAKRAFRGPKVSPDGRRVAVVIEGADNTLWALDLHSDTLDRVTFEGDADAPRWSPDGRRLFFVGNLKGPRSLFSVAADGTGKPEELFSRREWWINNFSVHPMGAGILMAAQTPQGHDLLFLREGSRDIEPFLATPADELQPAFSPDGRLVAYSSRDSGQFQVYVRPFPGPGRKQQLSRAGGGVPKWRSDGRELFFHERGRLMTVGVQGGPEPQFGRPQPLFEVPPAVEDLGYDVMPDGQRFVMVKPEHEAEAPLQIVVVPGFLEEMTARLANKR